VTWREAGQGFRRGLNNILVAIKAGLKRLVYYRQVITHHLFAVERH